MDNKKSDLYRQIADQLDRISSLEDSLKIEQQLRQTKEEQVIVALRQKDLVENELVESKYTIQELKRIGQEWHSKAIANSEIMIAVTDVFSRYSLQNFVDLEAMGWEAKGLIKSSDYLTEEEYSNEQEYIDNLINLSEEVKEIKGAYFNDQREEDEGQLLEF